MLQISQEHLWIVKNILTQHLPDNNEVWAFGSRVSGTSKKYSDLDLVIVGSMPIHTLTISLMKEAFSKSDLPYKVDLVDWMLIDDNFKKIILNNYEKIL